MVKKIFSILFVVLLMMSVSYSADLTLFGTYQSFFSSGSASDYVVGENEFPITDSHSCFGLGLSFSYKINASLSWGVEAGYNLKSTTVIRDPSDNDSVEIDTYQHILVFGTFGYRFLERLIRGNKISCFARTGAGIYYLPDKMSTETYTTALNYIIEIEPTDKRAGFAGFAGAGVEVTVYRNFGIVLSGRYLYIASQQKQSAIVGRFGFLITF
ncbi:outer membrane beta-barrel protein [Acidobacteriota bacterium]